MANMDRIFVSDQWESRFVIATVTTIPQGLSDYVPPMITN